MGKNDVVIVVDSLGLGKIGNIALIVNASGVEPGPCLLEGPSGYDDHSDSFILGQGAYEMVDISLNYLTA